MEQACTELAGPLAEVMAHAEVTLPRGAEDLASLIAHLDRYAETASPPSLLANPTSPANPVSPAKEDTKS
jgi:hypothetical protein